MKRFVDTARFDDPWYADLPVEMKLAWEFLWSKCDCAGVWKPNTRLAEFQLGTAVNWNSFREMVGERIKTLPNGGWWIVDFVKSQCGELSTECRAHIPVIKTLKEHKLLELDSLSIVYPMTTNSHKEKEKEKDKEKTDGGAGGRDNLPTTDRSKRIADLFHRRHSTPWSAKEISAFRAIKGVPDEDFALVEDFYKTSGHKFLRHDLGTFLNNFLGELDRARAWKSGGLNGHKTVKEEEQDRQIALHKTESKFGI